LQARQKFFPNKIYTCSKNIFETTRYAKCNFLVVYGYIET